MAVKKNSVQEEKVAADGYSTVPEPTNDVGSNKRTADKSETDERDIGSETFKSKAEALSALMKQFAEFKTSDLAAVFHANASKGPEANKRPLDNGNLPENPKAKLAKEDLDEMFEDLDDDLRVKTQTIFEATVNAHLAIVEAALVEEFEEKLDEAITEAKADLVESMDAYLDRVIEHWLEENALAVEEGLRTEITKDFIKGLHGLFAEHHIAIPDEELDILATYEEKLSEAEEKLNEAIEANIMLEKRLETESLERNLAEAFDDLTEGLTLTQVEKLKVLADSIEYDSVEEFKEKVTILKEATFISKNKSVKAATLNEANEYSDEETPVAHVAPEMRAYVSALSRSAKK